ncbi:MAG: methyltransferase domain-containing protein [Candidatus Eisenbacteria bacterium]|nr:methyltransferase domain-containing protein [Candidatus Eisenbacteria bacterium]
MSGPLNAAAGGEPVPPVLTSRRVAGLSNEELVWLFARLFVEELSLRETAGAGTEALRSYYGHLLTDGGLFPLGVLGQSLRLAPALARARALQKGARVLDTGCGYGSESLLFALTGTATVGVELVEERVAIARSRIGFYQSRCGFPLAVDFLNANIFRYLERAAPFDLIFTMEAISHIYPADRFLRLARERLTPGGCIVITDPNSVNPLAWARSVRIRGSLRHRPHQRFADPETGRPVDYGQEQVLSVNRLCRLLDECGFSVEEAVVSGFLCTSLLPRTIAHDPITYRLLRRMHGVISRIPALRSLGSIYTVVGRKR